MFSFSSHLIPGIPRFTSSLQDVHSPHFTLKSTLNVLQRPIALQTCYSIIVAAAVVDDVDAAADAAIVVVLVIIAANKIRYSQPKGYGFRRKSIESPRFRSSHFFLLISIAVAPARSLFTLLFFSHFYFTRLYKTFY